MEQIRQNYKTTNKKKTSLLYYEILSKNIRNIYNDYCNTF